MSIIRVLLQLILLALSSLGISTLMEVYKKTIRKDQAGVVEIRVVAGIISALAAVLFKVLGIFTPIISGLFTSVSAWFDVILYAVIIYVLQLFGDMQIVKNVIKYVTEKLLDNDKLTDEIKQMIKDFEETSKFSAKEVAQALLLVGITESKLKQALIDVGLSEDKADEVMEAYKEALNTKLANAQRKEVE